MRHIKGLRRSQKSCVLSLYSHCPVNTDGLHITLIYGEHPQDKGNAGSTNEIILIYIRL